MQDTNSWSDPRRCALAAVCGTRAPEATVGVGAPGERETRTGRVGANSRSLSSPSLLSLIPLEGQKRRRFVDPDTRLARNLTVEGKNSLQNGTYQVVNKLKY